MTYSCTDFTDDIINSFVENGLVDPEQIPEDEGQDIQAGLVLGATRKLLNANAEMLTALQECITEDGACGMRNIKYARLRMGAINERARSAIAKASQCQHGERGIVTCGFCRRSWCGECDPAPSALCHYCHGLGYSTAPREAKT